MKKLFGNKILFFAVVLVVLAGCASVAYAINRANQNNKVGLRDGINYDPATEEQKQAAEDKKISDGDAPKDTNPPTSQTITISSAEQDGSGRLVVKTELAGSGWKSCELQLTKDEQTITRNANAIYQSSFSTCLGFAVEPSELSSGTWNLQLTATKSVNTKETVTTTVTIR